jgi:hypothetical protein
MHYHMSYTHSSSEMSLNIDTITGGIVSDYPELATYRYPLESMHEILVMDGLSYLPLSVEYF